jgi:hypothetical protein
MNQQLTFILSMSSCLPLMAYLFVYKRVDKLFHPLIFIFLLGFIAEVSVRLNQLYFHIHNFTYYFYSTATIVFIYLFFWFYRNIKLLKNRNIFPVILVLYLGFILYNWVVVYPKKGFFNFFSIIIVYSLIVLFFSVELFSRQIFNRTRNIIYNPFFWIGMAATIFHSINVYAFGLNLIPSAGPFINAVYDIQKVSNVFCYILYTTAILCIPKTNNYIKLF